MTKLRIIAGLLIWLAIGASITNLLQRFLESNRQEVVGDLWQFLTAKRQTVTLTVPQSIPLQVGDPIYASSAENDIQQIGEIQQVDVAVSTDRHSQADHKLAVALLYPASPTLRSDAQLVYFSTRDSLTWVVETLLPPEKRELITREIAATYTAHRTRILAALQPVVVRGLADALRVIEQDLKTAVARHRDELEQLGNRYQEEVVEEEILPLVQREIWPIVREHAKPLASEIGAAMWQRASLWRFGWRYLYDQLPLTDKHLAAEEWNRFVQEEGLPILEEYSDEMVAAQRKIVSEVARNPKVRDAVRSHLGRIVDDPQFRKIVWNILNESVLDNARLQQTLENHWRGEEARRAVELAASYIEPTARRVGDLLLGTREEGISPEFAQVLRNQILGKDRRWLMLENAGASTSAVAIDHSRSQLAVIRGGRPKINPFALQLQND
jgi:hypothetical protein